MTSLTHHHRPAKAGARESAAADPLATGAAHPAATPDVAAIRSVHRTAPPARSDPAG